MNKAAAQVIYKYMEKSLRDKKISSVDKSLYNFLVKSNYFSHKSKRLKVHKAFIDRIA